MYDRVNVEFENCYGIKRLTHSFEFTNRNMPVSIYSPNGTMKTSFAKTFLDHSKGVESVDRVHPSRVTLRAITDKNGNNIPAENIFVINSYDETYKSEKISKLLVNKALKDEYDEIYENIGDLKEVLLKLLKKNTGLTKTIDIEEKLAAAFSSHKKNIMVALGRVQREVKTFHEHEFASVQYKKVFSPKVIEFLNNDVFRGQIDLYSSIYEKLLDNSNYFKKGVFNHSDASTIAKSLKSNGWFDSGHSVNLNTVTDTVVVKTENELKEIIQAEKDAILNDPDLANSFENIDKALKNAELKAFRDFLIDNQFLIPELKNIGALEEKLWLAYLHEHMDAYNSLMEISDKGQERIQEIIEAAKQEATTWREVIRTFNDRFSVPFIVNMDNQDDVILGLEAPQISFSFKSDENDDAVKIEEKKLKEVLSNGEKRALYILNIIFEVMARKESETETIFVVDDIADSFDYKNKYAIIEYLGDIKKTDYFHLILLTHNFDFYRTVRGRLGVYNPNKMHAVKSQDGIELVADEHSENPFVTWRNNLSEEKFFIASIPFIRNLAEYIGSNDQFTKLTALLHIKQETRTLKMHDIHNVYKEILHEDIDFEVNNPDHLILDRIYGLCDEIVGQQDERISLENKIILSIGIRLKTEEFIIDKINDDEYVNGITKNQTSKLLKKFKTSLPGQKDDIEFIERVNLMTPENIHLNSFMYEPILDMSDQHLKRLYSDASQLGS